MPVLLTLDENHDEINAYIADNNEPSEVLIIDNDEVLLEDVINILENYPINAKTNNFMLNNALTLRWLNK